jgi:hypothetical protein
MIININKIPAMIPMIKYRISELFCVGDDEGVTKFGLIREGFWSLVMLSRISSI